MGTLADADLANAFYKKGKKGMARLVVALLAMGLASTAFATVPANTELPIVSVGVQKFRPSEDSPATFRIVTSNTQNQLVGCTVTGTAHLEPKPQRLTLVNAKIQCPAGTKHPHEGNVDGQILGPDHRTGIRVTCRHQPGCLLGTLKDGDTGFFLFKKQFGN